VTAPRIRRRAAFATPQGGTYAVTATILDSRKGRPNHHVKLTFWVSGGATRRRRATSRRRRVQLIPDKKDYAPGNTAELLIQAPFYPPEGLVSWRRGGLVKTEKIALTGPTKVIAVPITDADDAEHPRPGRSRRAWRIGSTTRAIRTPKLPKRPAYAVGTLNLAGAAAAAHARGRR
jgi:hypothetical protein